MHFCKVWENSSVMFGLFTWGEESRFWLRVHLKLHASQTFITSLQIPECYREGKWREKYRKAIILARTRQIFAFAIPLEICKTSASEHCKLISGISDLQSQIL